MSAYTERSRLERWAVVLAALALTVDASHALDDGHVDIYTVTTRVRRQLDVSGRDSDWVARQLRDLRGTDYVTTQRLQHRGTTSGWKITPKGLIKLRGLLDTLPANARRTMTERGIT